MVDSVPGCDEERFRVGTCAQPVRDVGKPSLLEEIGGWRLVGPQRFEGFSRSRVELGCHLLLMEHYGIRVVPQATPAQFCCDFLNS